MNVDNPEDWEESDAEDESPLLTSITDQPRMVPSSKEVTMLCIVDRSGVHDIAVHWCRCQNQVTDERQLLAMGLLSRRHLHSRSLMTSGSTIWSAKHRR